MKDFEYQGFDPITVLGVVMRTINSQDI